MTSHIRKPMSLQHIDWALDEDWSDLVVGQTKHAGHHVGTDRFGNWFCRECSTDRIYIIPDEEVKRMLLVERKR